MAATTAAAGVVIKLEGAEIGQELMESIVEVKVKDNLVLPTVAQIKIIASDFHGAPTALDDNKLTVGKQLEIQFNARDSNVAETVFKGEIVSEEPDLGPSHAMIVVRAYDRAHRLNRDRKNRTFKDVTASDIVSKVGREHGLTVEATSTPDKFDSLQQGMETDWALLSRLALIYNYELFVDDTKLVFQEAGKTGSEITLTYTDELTAFRPRVTGVGAVDKVTVRGWDAKAKKAVMGTAGKSDVKLRSASKAANDNKNSGGTLGASGAGTFISDSAPFSQAEATALAKSAINRLASASTEAEGEAFGNPQLKSGVVADIQGVGNRFKGKYTLSAVTHSYRASTGYMTAFSINGTAARGLLDLFAPKRERDWGSQLVIGIVSDNKDPENTGRVKVKVPALGDDIETWWARVLTPSAGDQRGVFMLPAVNDEVVLGFENGDTRRPYVIGSLFNGKEKPLKDMVTGQPDGKHGNYMLASTEKILTTSEKETELKSKKPMLLESKDTMKVHSDKTMTIEVKGGTGDIVMDSGGAINAKATQAMKLEAGSSVTIKGTGSVSVESTSSLSVKAPTVSIEGSGQLSLKGAQVSIQGSAMVSISGGLINLG
jgi:phage protein D/phage baseplate assembly protein gpV